MSPAVEAVEALAGAQRIVGALASSYDSAVEATVELRAVAEILVRALRLEREGVESDAVLAELPVYWEQQVRR